MYFEDLKNTTKKASGFISNFRSNMDKTLFDVYRRPSYRKVSIYNSLVKSFSEEVKAYNFTVVSGGSGYFTMACENDDYIFYITYAHYYRIAK